MSRNLTIRGCKNKKVTKNVGQVLTKNCLYRIQDALKEQELAISRLRLIQQEREKMDADMDKLNVDMEEFKKYVHEKSFQMEVRYVIILCIHILKQLTTKY